MAMKRYQPINQDADMYGEELLNLVNTPIAPQKTIGPRPTGDNDLLYSALNLNNTATPFAASPASVVAPTTGSGYKYTGGNLQDYQTTQREAFKPQLLRAGTSGYTESGEYSTPDVYSELDYNKLTKDYLGQRDAARPGWDKSYTESLNALADYSKRPEYLTKLAKDIGYTGDTKTKIGEQSTGMSEGGNESFRDVYGMNPDMLDAMAGYKTVPTTTANGDPGIAVYKPDGTQVGVYRTGDADTKFDKIMEVVLPGALAAMTGGALAGPLLGAFGIAAPTALASTATAGAISGGLNAGIHGGNVLEGILKGGLTAGVTGGVSEVLGSTFAPSGVGSQVQNAISSGLKDIGLPADAANYVASYTKPFISGALTGGGQAALKGDNVLEGAFTGGASSVVNKGVGELFKAGAGVATAQPVKDAIFDGLTSLGLSEKSAGYIERLLEPVVEGGLSAAVKGGSVFEGMTTGALNSVAGDVGKSLGLNKTQSQAVATWMRTGDEGVLFDTLGKDLTNRAVNAAKKSVAKIGDSSETDSILYPKSAHSKDILSEVSTTAPADAQRVEVTAPTIEELLAQRYPADTQTEVPTPAPAPQRVDVTGKQPEFDLTGFLSEFLPPAVPGYEGNAPPTSEGQKEQRVDITGKGEEEEFPVNPVLSGEKSNINLTPGAGTQQVVVTGKKPDDGNLYNPAPREITAIQPSKEVDTGKYLDTLAKDVYSTIPEIVAAPAPSPVRAPTAPAAPKPQDKGLDLSNLMMMLGLFGGGSGETPPIELVKGLNFDPNSFYQGSSSSSMDDLVRLLQNRG